METEIRTGAEPNPELAATGRRVRRAGQYPGAGEGAILNGNYREERTFPTHRKHR